MDDRLQKIQKMLDVAEGNLQSARNLLREITGGANINPANLSQKLKELGFQSGTVEDSDEGAIIEGVFNGTEMIGPDGKTYTVPANYASKSKLVEGDGLKLTISADGSFIFKQILPVERRNIIGTLAYENGAYSVSAEGKSYKILTASVTFYKAESGDQVSIIVPRDNDSTWATLENVIKKPESETTAPGEPTIVEPVDLDTPNIFIPQKEDSPVADQTLPEIVLPNAVKLTVSESDDEYKSPESFVAVPEIEIPEIAEIPEPVPLEQNPPITTPDFAQTINTNVVPEELTQATPVLDDEGPKIEFPAGGQNFSDDEILAKLKANIAANNQIASAQTVPSPTNDQPNIESVQADMARIEQNSQINADIPISELDI